MEKIVQKCPCCGSWVNGEKVKSYTNKVARQGAKTGVHMATSAGGAATGAAVGSMFGPVGTAVGAVAGFIGSAMFNQKVNETVDKGIDLVEDNFMDMDYKFVCPNPSCGHEWIKNISELDSVSSNNSFSSSNHSTYNSVHSSNIIDKQRIYKFLAERGYNYAIVLSIESSGVRLKVSSQTRLGEDYIKGEADGSFFEGQMFMA